MKCPTCGKAELIRDTRDTAYTYKGETTVIAQVTGDHCEACGESITGPEESRRVSALMQAFAKDVNAGAIDPMFILATRRRLGLDQREAGAIFGGGLNGFSRYETGEAKPHRSTLTLLRLLDKHPELLPEIRALQHGRAALTAEESPRRTGRSR